MKAALVIFARMALGLTKAPTFAHGGPVDRGQAGHFALDTAADKIAALVRGFIE